MPRNVGFPSRSMLLRFLKRKRPVSITEAAHLLGTTTGVIRRKLSEERMSSQSDMVPWSEVAFELFMAWPRSGLFAVLDANTDVIPHGLHLMQPAWTIPIYIVRAMEAQSRSSAIANFGGSDRGRRQRTVADYVADVLHQAIDPDLLGALTADPEFTDAYNYGGNDE